MAKITSKGGVAEAHNLDVSKNEDIVNLINTLRNQGGRIDVLINNGKTKPNALCPHTTSF